MVLTYDSNILTSFPGHRDSAAASYRGAEIPFQLMTYLAGVQYPLSFVGVELLKGHTVILLPMWCDGEAVQWHLEQIEPFSSSSLKGVLRRYKQSLSSMSSVKDGGLPDDGIAAKIRALIRRLLHGGSGMPFYSGARLGENLDGSNFELLKQVVSSEEELRRRRHFLGCYQAARLHLATRDADYGAIEDSGLKEEGRPLRSTGFNVAVGSSGKGIAVCNPYTNGG